MGLLKREAPAKDQTPMGEVARWLSLIGLERYAPVFEEEGYDELFVVAELSEEDMDNLGINDEATRKELLSQAAFLKKAAIDGTTIFFQINALRY